MAPDAVQILDNLPDHLAISVLQAYLNPHRFDTLFRSLPAAHHPLILQATFPQIDSDHELNLLSGVTCSIDARLQTPVELHIVLQVLKATASFSSIRSLTCGAHVFPSARAEEELLGDQFTSMLCQLTHLTLLDLGFKGLRDNDSFLTPHVAAAVARALPGVSTLRHLSLWGSASLRRTGCQELLEALQSCTSLTWLSLTSVAIVSEAACTRRDMQQQGHGSLDCSFRESIRNPSGTVPGVDSGCSSFGMALVQLTRLQSLSLHACHCDEQSLLPIQEMLEHSSMGALSSLTSLSLRPASILAHLSRDRSRDHSKHLATVIKHMTALQRISMMSSGGAVAALISALKDLKQLRYIDVCDSIGWDDVFCLSTALKSLPELEHLDFGGLGRYEPAYRLSRFVCHDSIQALAAAVPEFSRLQYLSLSQCPLATCKHEAGALSIAEALGKHSSLRTFAMDFSNCSYRVMWALGFSLGSHSGLQHLDMHAKYDEPAAGSVVADETVEEKLTNATVQFVHHLSTMCSLTGLRFSVRRAYLGAPEAATVAIASSLSALSKLESLDLSELRVSDRAACDAMATGLSSLTKLKTLNLISNRMLPPDVVALARTIRALPLLSRLDLSQNRMRDAGALALAGELKGLQGLRTLNLSDSGVTQRGLLAVMAALADHPTISISI